MKSGVRGISLDSMDVSIRPPRKSSGVPRESRGGTLLAELDQTLAGAGLAPLAGDLERAGFYDLSLMAQMELLAATLDRLTDAAVAIPALEASVHQRVRGLAPFVARLAFLEDIPCCVDHLRRQSAIPGTWIQEGSQMALKRLVVRHGLGAVLPQVEEWIADPDPQVRRCLIEALRPRGVWTGYIAELRRDPEPLKPLLDRVLDDPSLYVRKAAANCLNDVGKDHPETLLRWCSAWAGGGGAERAWLLNRGLRSLLKSGAKGAHSILGGAAAGAFEASWTSPLPERVDLNQLLPVTVRVRLDDSAASEILVVAILAGPGRGQKPRVRRYQIGRARIAAGTAAEITGRIHFVDFNHQPRLSGRYSLAVEVNGTPVEERSFAFTRDEPLRPPG